MSDRDDLAAARDRIALAALASGRGISERIGSITLRPHQRTAVVRLLDIIARYRGALLADAVGLGKTFVALTIARAYSRPLVICPAALRPMWTRAMATARMAVPIVTIESLARDHRPSSEPDLAIIDEAHHLRTPTTLRYAAAARLTRHARVLLLSATPLHNRRRDLSAVLALFLGSEVHAWSDAELARVIVRRDEKLAEEKLPRLVGPHALSPGNDDDCLEAIGALPAAIPAADEGTAAALATMSMVHLWASSRAALVASLRKRRARATALRDAIASGHLPTAAELSAWQYADESLQLAFPFCVSTAGTEIDVEQTARQLDVYAAALSTLLTTLGTTPDPDQARAALLRTIRVSHRGSRVVAFSQYAQTVTALGRILRAEAGLAVVTASGARIATGLIPREEILAQFAGDAPATPVAERVDLLLSTDLLSEGVDLRGASVIVHLDLPWNPARLVQRVGRARRIGSPHEAIHVYTFVPPAAAERLLTLERRLAAKMRIAADVVGGAAHPAIPSPPVDAGSSRSPVAAMESLRATLSSWLDPAARRGAGGPVIAAASAPDAGWLAVVHLDSQPRLIQGRCGRVIEDPVQFLAAAMALGDPRPVDSAQATMALAQTMEWVSSQALTASIGLTPAFPPAKRAFLDRLSRMVARTPRHRRAAIIAVAQRARAVISTVAGIGAESALAELAGATVDDEAWIDLVDAFGGPLAARPATEPPADTVGALIILCPPR